MKGFLVFPHQLFKDNLQLGKDLHFFIVEDYLYFNQYKFHKQKLVLHRASMKYYEHYLQEQGHPVTYIPFNQARDMEQVFKVLQKQGIEEVEYRDVTDDWLGQRLEKAARDFRIRTTMLATPMFLCTEQYIREYFHGKKKFLMADFYMDQRRRFNILMDGAKPKGGRWSFDEDNRKKLPKKEVVPETWFPSANEWTAEAKTYVATHFPDNYGDIDTFKFAVTHRDAYACLTHFLNDRFEKFGTYEDAIAPGQNFLYHSVISMYLNTGLLTPVEVLEHVLEKEDYVSLNSLEGYVRQVMGWREYMRAVYLLKGRRDRTYNFWKHTRKIPYAFWTASTGIVPVDSTIQRVLKHAFNHHIERLMVMGNFMLLCEFDPDEIYKWFMEMYIDAYDWVMVPNIYSMSQYASGGTTTTKPYISSSNYILKMSLYKKEQWTEVWDALYWRFIVKHRNFFAKNPRLSMMTLHLQKMGKEKILDYYRIAEDFLDKLRY